MFTMFVGLGGTGTQIAGTICNLYPMLQEARITDQPFVMYILDKDTNSEIFKACSSALHRYQEAMPLMPFKKLPPYTFDGAIYQNMQKEVAVYRKNTDGQYTVMDIIGHDKPMAELASMCWSGDKRDESLRDGNNRDPSRGSLDAGVCLEHLTTSRLFGGIDTAINEHGETGVRLVILGGATGGMGSSLIVPLAEALKQQFPKLRIDMVILGTYFALPARKKGKNESAVDDIGTTMDSFYRAADQIQELAAIVSPDWRVYYVAMPANPRLDDICGEFRKNTAPKRKAHLLELAAALGAFDLENKEGGYYETALTYDGGKNSEIEWDAFPLGSELKQSAYKFLRLVSVLACNVLPALLKEPKDLRGDVYLKRYLAKPDDPEKIEKMRELLKVWLQNVKPYFEMWHEIQLFTRLGREDGKQVVNLLPAKDMENMAATLAAPQRVQDNFIPLLEQKTWMNYVGELKPDKKAIQDAKGDEAKILGLMIADIYTDLSRREVK
jgi:hypothetical protein